MTTAVGSCPTNQESVTELTVYNLPATADESEVHSIFPSAQYVNLIGRQNGGDGSNNTCVLYFDTPHECQKVYAECHRGKEVNGRTLHVQYGGSWGFNAPTEQPRNTDYRDEETCGGNQYAQDTRYDRPPAPQRDYSHDRQQCASNRSENGCTLTVSNLPYTSTKRDIEREFPEAFRVVLSLDERGRSRGVAQLSFSNQEQCNEALNSCNYKTLNGRPIRGRIMREQDNQSGYGGGGQRNFNDRQGRQNDYNSGRRDREDNRFQSNRGGRGGSGNNRFGPRDYNRENRSDQQNQRRERSPNRGEPVRGYGSTKGPRITSAVIHRPGDNASSSSSEED